MTIIDDTQTLRAGLEPLRGTARPNVLAAAAFDAFPEAQLVLDPHDRIVLATNEARRLFGLAEDDSGLSLDDLAPPVPLRDYFDVPARARQGVLIARTRWSTPGGERLLDVAITPLCRWEDASGTSLVLSDAAGRTAVEAELAATREKVVREHGRLRTMAEELEIGSEQLRSLSRSLEAVSDQALLANAQMKRMCDQLERVREEQRRRRAELSAQRDRLAQRAAWTEQILREAAVTADPRGEHRLRS